MNFQFAEAGIIRRYTGLEKSHLINYSAGTWPSSNWFQSLYKGALGYPASWPHPNTVNSNCEWDTMVSTVQNSNNIHCSWKDPQETGYPWERPPGSKGKQVRRYSFQLLIIFWNRNNNNSLQVYIYSSLDMWNTST